jgi:hypothetical protein
LWFGIAIAVLLSLLAWLAFPVKVWIHDYGGSAALKLDNL